MSWSERFGPFADCRECACARRPSLLSSLVGPAVHCFGEGDVSLGRVVGPCCPTPFPRTLLPALGTGLHGPVWSLLFPMGGRAFS